MFELNKFNVVLKTDDSQHGVFEIGPLPKGYGSTIGNVIRRILLSSISGAAVTAVKIKGVNHEYTALDGLQEDVLSLVLNIKNLAVRLHTDGPVILKLVKQGTKNKAVELKASDFEANADIEILNPDFVLGTVSGDETKIELDVVIERGVGYHLADESKRQEIGMIPVDGIFSPVKHVRHEIVQTRLGQQTDLDQINLEVFTNGAYTPKEVFLQAVEIFDLFANRLVDMAGGDSQSNSLDIVTEETVIKEERSLPISDLDISTRLRNSLMNSGIADLMELNDRSKAEMLSFKGMGKKSFNELIAILHKYEINVKG